MAEQRLVQCFGTKVRPHKEAKRCRRKYRWIAIGVSGNFGRKGAQACPYCGTPPDFKHPLNRYYAGQMTLEEAKAAMNDYLEEWEKNNS